MKRVPVLIVSGYLGAGKTTLVRRLLTEARRENIRLAIVSNEFGDTGIDRALLDAGQDGFVELDGGCVCCRLSDALGETLTALVGATHPDRIVLETSGVALPGEILVQFWRPPLSELSSEETVVVLVDAEGLLRRDAPDETFLHQVEAADLLVLTKVDLVSGDGGRLARGRLAEWSGGQPILEAVHGDVPMAALFPPDPEGLREQRRQADAEVAPHDHDTFGTEEITLPDGLEDEAIAERIRSLGALRAKGFVRGRQGVRVVQGVGPRVEVRDPDVAPPDTLLGKVVLIRRVEVP